VADAELTPGLSDQMRVLTTLVGCL